jgi:hypothetical protein
MNERDELLLKSKMYISLFKAAVEENGCIDVKVEWSNSRGNEIHL